MLDWINTHPLIAGLVIFTVYCIIWQVAEMILEKKGK